MERNLDNIFDSYKVSAKCISYSKFDSYEFYDCCLVKSGKIKDIVGIKNEIQFKLKLSSINISLLPEEGVIRIEGFNPSKTRVYYESMNTSNRTSKTLCFLGKNYYDKDVSIDLKDCPHLLIGGSTGSGKSVLLNTIIRNLLETDVNLYLFDPKRIEFTKYQNEESNVQVFYDAKNICGALDFLVNKMESNYDLISKYGSSVIKPTVVIADEYGDLSLSSESKTIKEKITILSQKARAAKIHLIFSTQRPSASILDGDIKANFTSRIALKCASQYDSKVILGEPGAEDLLGKGDAILKDSSNNKIRFRIAM